MKKVISVVLICIVTLFLSLLILKAETLQETNIQPVKENTEENQEVNLETLIGEKIKQAKECIKFAEESYNKGEYDKANEYAEKAKEISLEIEQLKQELRIKKEAEKRLREAREVVGEIREDGIKYAPETFKLAESKLKEAEEYYNQRGYNEAYDLAGEAITLAEKCKNIISQKKAEEASKSVKIEKRKPVKSIYKIKTRYKVRLIPHRRDCLWRIAEYKFIYGNPWKWPIIYKANKDKIKDPDLIYPGQIFDIPELDKNGKPILLTEEPSKELPVSAEQTNIKKPETEKTNIQENKEPLNLKEQSPTIK